jgi:hypothetical protein
VKLVPNFDVDGAGTKENGVEEPRKGSDSRETWLERKVSKSASLAESRAIFGTPE